MIIGRRDGTKTDGPEPDGPARAAAMLAALPLSPAERRFAAAVGERVVDLVVDAHWRAGEQGRRHADVSVPAAVAYALALLDEPAPGYVYGRPATPA